MGRQHHHIKCETRFFQDVESGEKKFEIRKNDRDYQVGDMIYLQEVVAGVLTGRELAGFEIRYIFYGGKYGIPEDYCVFNW